MALLHVKPTGTYLHMVKPWPFSPGPRFLPPLPSSDHGVSVRVQGLACGSACALSCRLVQEGCWAPLQHTMSAQKCLSDARPQGCHSHHIGAAENPFLLPCEGSICAPCILQLALSRAHPTNNSTPSDPEALPETRVRLAVSVQKGEPGKKPQANVTFEKARAKGAFW